MALQDALLGAYGQVSTQIRKIRSIQNSIDSCDVTQHAEHWIAFGSSRVPINPPEHISSCASLLATRNEPNLIDDRETRGKIGHRASGMRENVFHVWRAREPVRVVHLSDSAIGVCWEVNKIVGESQSVGNSVR
jgi:hypothetical protein